MVVEPKLVRLANFLQDHFKFGDSNETLSDQDARSLACIAATRLSIGAFLLQPSTLGQFSSSQMDGVSWPTFAFLRCGCPSGTALSPRLCRCGGAHVAVACCWCHCTRSPHRCGVVLLRITRGRMHECSVTHRVACYLCWFAIVFGSCACARRASPGHISPQRGPPTAPGYLCASELPPRPCESVQGNPGIPPRSFIRFSRCRTARESHVSGPCDTACIVHQR